MKGADMSGEIKPTRKTCCGTCKHWRRIEGRQGKCQYEGNKRGETDIDYCCPDYTTSKRGFSVHGIRY